MKFYFFYLFSLLIIIHLFAGVSGLGYLKKKNSKEQVRINLKQEKNKGSVHQDSQTKDVANIPSRCSNATVIDSQQNSVVNATQSHSQADSTHNSKDSQSSNQNPHLDQNQMKKLTDEKHIKNDQQHDQSEIAVIDGHSSSLKTRSNQNQNNLNRNQNIQSVNHLSDQINQYGNRQDSAGNHLYSSGNSYMKLENQGQKQRQNFQNQYQLISHLSDGNENPNNIMKDLLISENHQEAKESENQKDSITLTQIDQAEQEEGQKSDQDKNENSKTEQDLSQLGYKSVKYKPESENYLNDEKKVETIEEIQDQKNQLYYDPINNIYGDQSICDSIQNYDFCLRQTHCQWCGNQLMCIKKNVQSMLQCNGFYQARIKQ